ncbi:hypothetical protein JM18_003333 [Phytophthora kernoviae]|uniref:Rhamnogalacturonan endolyase n=2 Tax=Phytophthora kernoviae TaxID=325452 RepID=A0A922APZ4_9STRA|nr:hypothetical protein G195_004787 [Phytophthora kernoviae 00238/432]KAG2526946.1 hypothetical protein JM18_003333 [Phytophthora kernoviae]
MLGGRLVRTALLLMGGLLAASQADNQATTNFNFQFDEERTAASSFGYKEGDGTWVINSGKGLVVTVTQGSCDITSMLWNDAELQISKKKTHINSGLGKVTSTIESLKDSTIRINCKTKGLEHTYLFRPEENAIYMGTYHTAEMALGELRFLARLDRKPLKNGMSAAATIDGMSAIEAHDVYADSKDVTASKFYSGIPFIEDKVHGVTGDAGGVFFVMSDNAYEKSVGGPFFRDINNQCTEANELTFYMFSDHTRTEEYRYGFHGPFALVFTDGSTPTASDVDFDFFQDLTDLTGFVTEADRGTWTGGIVDKNGVLGNTSVVVGFSNADAQYWVSVDSTTEPFTSPAMIAGSYNATIYRNQLPVSSEPITIKTGATQGEAQSLTVTHELVAKPVWRIGEWDGTPDGFLNADKIHTMHPSDSRMEAWTPLNFTVGTDKDSVFPMVMFRAVNDPITINFALTAEQAGADRTLKVGIPLSQNNGRCSVTVNAFSAKVPTSSSVKTRGVTRGVTVGNYVFYEYAIPKTAFIEGANKIVMSIVSGNEDSLGKWLSASVVFDALELVLVSATLLLTSGFLISTHAATSFGYTSSGGSWVISSGEGLTVTMDQDTCDITSMLWNDMELQYSAKNTHVNSGLGSVTSSLKTLDDSTIRVICKTTGLEQTYLFRPNENAIYMGTYHTTDLDLAELRFLARLDRTALNNGMSSASEIDGMSAIESTDVYADDEDITASKFYSSIQFIDDKVHGVTGDAGGVYFIMSDYAYEASVGGPFFRDINNQCTTANELTFYMFSDHTRTENYRYGFHGPYALVFTNGTTPSTSDVDFDLFQDLGLTGFVTEDKRGTLTGTITDDTDVLGSSNVIVGFSNDDVQYWVSMDSGASTFTSPLMRAGRYNTTIYKEQLAVSSDSVLITAGATKTQTLDVTYELASSPIWRIGEWDGTPTGFLNAANIHTMHPSDSRMSTWESLTFTPGTDDDSAFPMAMFRAVNDPITLSFTLTSDQAADDRTLKIGLTLAQSSGRCSVSVNSDWTADVPSSVAVKTRGVTRGVTLGNYKLYEYAIPSSTLVTGTNSIELSIASGSTDPDEKWLSASVVFDALELV